MIRSNLEGVEFVAANTDAQALANSLAPNKIQLGVKTTKGLGAGSFPDRGRAAAEENIEEIERYLEGNNMVFIAAGMGGGTGTGAAPVIARLARERDILTVGVVTKPFHFEGKYRMETAEAGIEELKKYVDTLIVIPNQNLFRIANEHTTFESAFKMADDVLHAGVRGITDLITMPGLVNLDFADIRTIMTIVMMVLMSAKSRFTNPGIVIKSVMPRTPACKTSSAILNADSKVVCSLAILKRFWFGITISVSTYFFNSSMPASAVSMRYFPSK
jgi:cell division protein FtsZ